MIVCGIDIGSVATKTVILKDRDIISKSLALTKASPKLAAEEALSKALRQINLSEKDISYIVSTGYGRRIIEFGDRTVTEITCCGRGATQIGSPLGKIQTIIDLGGQDSKVISLDEEGGILDFVMNDKCSAGTGRFLEVMASVLEERIGDLGEIALRSNNPVRINSTCTVFSESEVISLIAQGRNKEDIISGICASIAERIAGMITQVGKKESIFFCGGGARNRGIHRFLEDKLGVELYVPQEPEFVIALGASLIAIESLKKI